MIAEPLNDTLKNIPPPISLSLASERAKDVDTFKNMYDPKYLKEYLEIHVKVEVEKAKALQQANLDSEKNKELIDYLTKRRCIHYRMF